jgi:16S rRNA (guanine(966)-N(2))-methyltransferase RsmD
MRIITGKFKGRELKAPKNIRPTEDRVRKALFDILGDMSGLSFLELFAGSGAVGLEAVSLGASEVVLVEKERANARMIQGNLASLAGDDAGPSCEVMVDDALDAVRYLSKSGKKFDIAFADPPYYMELAEKTLQSMAEYDIVTASGLLIIQHFKKDPISVQAGPWRQFRQAKYGDSVLSFYEKNG